MTMIQTIRQWFAQDCPYLRGVAIYRQIGGEYPIHTFDGFEQAAYVPSSLEQRLQYALQSYVENHPEEEIEIEEVSEKRTIVQNQTAEEEPAVILQMRAQARRFHKRHAHLKAQLASVQTNEERYEIAYQIMEVVIPKLDGIYDQIRDWQETGALPKAPRSDEVAQAIQLTIKRMNRRSYLTSRISLLKGKLKKGLKDQIQQKYQKQMLDNQIELKTIEEELDL